MEVARITVDIYSQARNPEKRAAQQRLVQMILPEGQIRPVVASSRSSSTQSLDCVPELSASELQVMWNALDQEELFM